MNRKMRQKRTLLLVVCGCLISTCVLAVLALIRSRQVQQMSPMSYEYDIFWDGDEKLLTKDKVVVFDVRYTDGDVGILLSLAERIEKEAEEKDITPIFLGAQTEGELRSRILTSEEMDLYIALSVGREEADTRMFGTKCFYNEAYYVPDYNNVWLSDRLLQNVVTAISGRALGMEACGERDILVGLQVPSSLLQIGYVTNEMEGELLRESKYLKKIAEGIVETVEEYYEGR